MRFNFNFMNTNARSLSPKINSLIDCFEELDARVRVITETWLCDRMSLEEDVMDLREGAGLDLIYLNRDPLANGVAYGGVAVVSRTSSCNFKRWDLPNPGGHEVLAVAGSVAGYSRKMVVVAGYKPPGLAPARARSCVEYISDVILEAKRKYQDPHIILSGDFNQWQIQDAVLDDPNVQEVFIGPSRGCLLYTSPSPRD